MSSISSRAASCARSDKSHAVVSTAATPTAASAKAELNTKDLIMSVWEQYNAYPSDAFDDQMENLADLDNKRSIRYRYRPLPKSTSIRVLALAPATYLCSELHSELHIEDLNQLQRGYDAISYAWSEPWYTSRLFVRNRLLNITPTLAAALRRLRSTTMTRYFWADAVCINQESPLERAHQVSMMAKIYHNARFVCVHLGNVPSSEEVVINFFLHMGNKSQYFIDQEHSSDIKANDNLIEASAMEAFGKTDLSKLRQFLSLPWFRRRWTFQEIACHNVSRPPFVFYGRLVTSWVHIAASWPVSAYSSAIRSSFLQSISSIWHVAGRLSKRLAFISGSDAEGSSVLSLLNLCHMLECGDPRDTVYALWALSSDINGSEFAGVPCPKIQLRIDYTIPVDIMFGEFAEEHIKVHSNLDILHSAGAFPRPSQPDPLPSWIPRWKGPRHYMPLLHPWAFRAGISAKCNALPEVDAVAKGELKCSGINVDKIIDRSEGSAAHLEGEFIVHHIHHWVQPLLRCGLLSGSLEAQTACLRTLAASLTLNLSFLPGGDPFINDTLLLPEAEHSEILQLVKDNRSRIFDIVVKLMQQYSHYDLSAQDQIVANLICQVMSGRCLFVTKCGMIGVGPAEARAGDEAWILAQAKTPFLLRQTDKVKVFTLVGDAFIDHLMDGEFLDRNILKLEGLVLV